ncbi:SGNH/GDSL hydrolase family protein [Nodularia sphaerocarpa]|uniref:SGNH/GDSL hydrolase family protein n=1 Tax=Nodularia sphaerocarpa TaxID=137816 RepID=UPI001EFBEDA1|nr:SGNH/GDSL hydrolase family protein [Nodularia sphaerocarpa]MDB9373578.1 SGNH/GDSL hydrolase family protein [Nodularia sphaerocarpa CS-585]MDB9378037.1 SGNH/GDSL hydrolase family protein [Nodularia sphaerocarpa CS-585A2]ULP74366.1 GDSL lipase [Nodularia sphaerocarpa UHCC 0038]
MQKIKPWLQNLFLMLAGVIVGLLIVETFAISTGVAAPQKSKAQIFYQFIQPDAQLGYKPKSNLRDFNTVWQEAKVAEVANTDSYGFRNLGKDYTKSNLYFVGDSFTWGQWVSEEQTFPRLVESDLKQPVINLGVPGYSFAQYETLFNEWITKYKPNTVILSIVANDLTNYSADIGKKIYDTLKERSFSPWYEKTFFYNLVWKNSQKSLQTPIGQPISKEAKNGLTLFDLSLVPPESGVSVDSDYLTSDAVVKVEAALSRIIELSQENQVKLLVFLVPSKESAYIKDYMELFPDHLALLKNEEIGYQRLCNLALSKNVSCVNLTDDFRENSQPENLYFDIDGHWNPAGHELAAKVMLNTLNHNL